MFYNVKGEKIVYISNLSSENILNVFLAGTTCPNPEYKSSHNITVSNTFDRYCFEYVTAGVGYIETGEKKHTVRAGDFFFLNKLKPHYYYTDPAQLLEKVFITVNGTLIDKLTEVYGLTESVIIRRVDVHDLFLEMHEILASVTDENKSEKFRDIEIKMLELMQKVSSTTQSAALTPKKELAELIRDYIENSFEVPFTLDTIANFFFISKTHAIRVFKEKYGVSPMQYALNRRMEIARHLLSYTKLHINEISAILCFSSSKHFASTFHKRCGISPQAYRKTLSLTL